MDVYCRHCGEPWEMAHLRNEAPFDILPEDVRSLSERDFNAVIAKAEAFAKDGELTGWRRQALAEHGWEFGLSLFIVLRCPCCEANGPQDEERAERIALLQEISGHDPDGMASDMEDLL
jgi:hypothetical protein